MDNFLEKIKTTRILAIVGIIALILGAIVPYVDLGIISFSLWNSWAGIIILLLVILDALYIFRDLLKKYISSIFNNAFMSKIENINERICSLVITGLIAIFVIYLTINLRSTGLHFTFKYYSIGFYLTWLGLICLVAYTFLHNNKLNQPNINANQNDIKN